MQHSCGKCSNGSFNPFTAFMKITNQGKWPALEFSCIIMKATNSKNFLA